MQYVRICTYVNNYVFCRTFVGIFYYHWREGNVSSKSGETDEQTQMAEGFVKSAKLHGLSEEKYTYKKLKGLPFINESEEIDITDRVHELYYAQEKNLAPNYDPYKDEDYLSERAKMKKDDPKFDAEFWGQYFRNIDKKRQSETINKTISRFF